jgi:small subunit ribosomal protein S20
MSKKSRKIRDSLKRRHSNRIVKSGVKSTVSELKKAVAGKETVPAGEILKKACRQIDKAASKGVIHSNTAARKKSRLTKKVNSITKSDNQ